MEVPASGYRRVPPELLRDRWSPVAASGFDVADDIRGARHHFLPRVDRIDLADHVCRAAHRARKPRLVPRPNGRAFTRRERLCRNDLASARRR
ncbi:MAG: hypothetical protein WD027_09670, partial [Gaiellales bacterium]